MTIQNLLEWQNLIFVLPMVLALILLGLSMSGIGEHDSDIDHDVGLEHDVNMQSAGNIPHDLSTTDVDHDTGPSVLSVMLSAFGIGKAPLSVLGFCWLMIFGFVGLVLNSVWQGAFGSINILVIISASIALISSLTITSFLARAIYRFMPQTQTEVEKLSDFINREAVVRYTVTTDSGTITLIDKYGNQQTLMAKRDESCNQDLTPDTPVVILSYLPKEKVFSIIPTQKTIKQ